MILQALNDRETAVIRILLPSTLDRGIRKQPERLGSVSDGTHLFPACPPFDGCRDCFKADAIRPEIQEDFRPLVD
jgi:hypothetical protein